MSSYARVPLLAAVAFLAFVTSARAYRRDASFYLQDFDSTRGSSIKAADFSGHSWMLDAAGEDRFLTSVPPDDDDRESRAVSPKLPFTADRDRNGGFTVEYHLELTGDWREPRRSRRPGRTSMDILDKKGERLITLTFRPNPPADVDEANVTLTNHLNGKKRSAKTGTPTPFGRGSEAGTVDLKIAFGPSRIEVFYGENGSFGSSPLISTTFRGEVPARRLAFRHAAGSAMKNDRVRVDDVSVRPNDVVLLPTRAEGRFDRELLASDGGNTTEVFDSAAHRQAVFRLSRSTGGEGLVGNWDELLGVVQALKDAGAGIGAMPLLVTKADFVAVREGAASQPRTFFMAAFASEKIPSRRLTILTSAALQVTDDPIESIVVEADGTAVPVETAGQTPFEFAGPGEKEVVFTVRFASGFVGTNRSRVVVE
jgi:hypothetical protein